MSEAERAFFARNVEAQTRVFVTLVVMVNRGLRGESVEDLEPLFEKACADFLGRKA